MKTFLAWACVAAVLIGLFGAYSTCFPGTNAPAKGGDGDGGEVAERMRDHVDGLVQGASSRNTPGTIGDAGAYLERQLSRAGLDVKSASLGNGATSKTIFGEIPGTKYAREVVIVATHYDGPRNSPGADAGASGPAVLLETARALSNTAHERTLRFVLFPDGFARGASPESAATAYAKDCKSRGETIAAVLYLDSVGLFEETDTQTYPFPFMLAFPSRANFLGVVGGYGCRDLASKTTELMRNGSGLAVQGLVLPEFAPGTGFSPHAAFWDAGMPAVVLTDTGSWRSPRFGTMSDTADRLNYPRMARVATALSRAVGQLVKKANLSV